jgi:hypothetical protein
MKSIGQVAYQKPLAKLGMEELAARQHTLQNPSGGIAFARNVDGEQKTAAREKVLELFTRGRWPGHLHMLTLPGIQWRFERKLLGVREVGWLRKERPNGTYFTACENDRAIYFAAVAQMPGLHTPESELKRIKHYSFAEMGVKTSYASFFFGNADDMMALDCWNSGWHAAWLDYTGPLTVERMALIRTFFHRYVNNTLIVTALKARWNEATSRAIEKAGGHSQWLRKHLDGEILHDIEYIDTSPMAQFAVRHRSGLWMHQISAGAGS